MHRLLFEKNIQKIIQATALHCSKAYREKLVHTFTGIPISKLQHSNSIRTAFCSFQETRRLKKCTNSNHVVWM